MKFYKQELLKGQEIDFKEDKIYRFFKDNQITAISVYLIEIHGVSNPCSLSLRFQIDPKQGLFNKYCLMFLHYRMLLLLEKDVYFFDSTKIKGLQNLPVDSTFKLRIDNEVESENAKVILYCKTDYTLDLEIQKTEYL